MKTAGTDDTVYPKEMGTDATKRPFGINVVGHVSANIGLGVAARNIIELVIESGLSVAVYDLDPGLGRGDRERRFQSLNIGAVENLPYAINLLVLPPPTLEWFLPKYSKSILGGNYLNAALSFWELCFLPTRWIPPLDAMDVVIGMSDFIRSTFQFVLSGPQILGGLMPLYLPQGIAGDRRRFELPDNAVIFVCSFETNSDPQRKNPFAAIDAFLEGVGADPQAYLVIKVNDLKLETGEHPVLGALRERCVGHRRIRLVSEPLSYVDVLSLYASCDVYVSLHRAEGLGLGLMEAMILGKPVIATAWSGNMSFMNHTNSCPVSYSLTPVNGSPRTAYSNALLGEGAFWAEPNVPEAAAWMHRLVGDQGLRARIGERASADVRKLQAEAKQGRFLQELVGLFENRSFLPTRVKQTDKPRHLRELLAERDRRITRLESDLRWITNKRSYRILKAMKELIRRGPVRS